MNLCEIAVFIWFGTLTHCLADLLTHWKKKRGIFLYMHCFLYTLCFIPLFWWLEVNLLWLIFISLSHLIIDSQGKFIPIIVNKILREENEKDVFFKAIYFGLDQALHLLIIGIVSFFI